ncbi:UDP-N-acetylmuramoyl-L-alanyl-D-glutamate--L-lysine ligase [Streptococcus sp. NLN76]|uniref:UDP-N-acetylmuramoyl-L-alanyl-D-glutamate--L- lysine ligase n=1 Tax=Streptococcus sp. NLN76 TaxID=2822800 RepID=UPI0018AAE04F|nr:UDP-N-acetylmuramoyl-L-alanyl-D-glutamate--L-lysine ligase [Streptococcus sp. NLN76]MBF8970303.1 UDP-N-acetylmuramoyl-L-alanyl-D-glutamate--L-lysine ligase [Streptococcus sp. NLN76]
MMKLETALQILKGDHNFRAIVKDDHYYYQGETWDFRDLSYDSREVSEQTLFFAKGHQFKAEYLEAAIQQGLKYYVSEIDHQVSIPVILVNDIKQAMSLVAMAFYDHPERKLKLLAFTGTKGKTTAAYFAFNILKEEAKPAMLSTMNSTLDGTTFFKSQLTTPESLDLFAMMAQAVKNGRTHFIMEVSSQAYLVKRVYGLTFDVGVFLNISPDHIGPIEHPTYEDYFYHKRQLLANSRYVILNQQMDHIDFLLDSIADKAHTTYGAGSPNSINQSSAFHFQLTGPLAGGYDIQLIGDFNQENALAAALACHRLGASPAAIKAGIAHTKVDGRMEVLSHPSGAKIFIDYAHNGDSLKKLIDTVAHYQTGKIALVLGATGNKGESRRKDFGLLLNDYPSVEVYLTADDPNYEDPEAISQEIASYIHRPVHIIPDRELAIQTILKQSYKPDDAIIIAGKGADAFQIVQGEKIPYPGDPQVVQNYL